MNNEIKEIINDLRKTADNSIFVVCSSQEELDKIPKYTANFLSVNDRQAKILLDYITNLQEENKNLKNEQISKYQTLKELQEEINELKAKLEMYENGVYYSSENDKLQERIDKAIEYIENNYQYGNDISCYEELELLNILKGENNE